MSEVCQQQMKDMRVKDKKTGKWKTGAAGWTYVPCGKVCNPGQRLCPRHTFLAAIEQKDLADKDLAAREKAKAGAVASGKR
jgi:hypothetical protein